MRRPACLIIYINLTVYSVEQVFYLLIPALGVGFLFQAPLLALQAAMPVKDMATSTATFGLLRTLGGTVGISIGEAIFSSVSFFPRYMMSYLIDLHSRICARGSSMSQGLSISTHQPQVSTKLFDRLVTFLYVAWVLLSFGICLI